MNRKVNRECECTCEYVLPDYMGDIKKILTCRARVIPTGKFASGDSVELSGCVEYEVLYVDSENKLTAISAASDYEIPIPIDGETYVDVGQRLNTSTPLVRVTGPRKLVIKSSVNASFTVNEDKSIETAGDAFNEGTEPETLSEELEYERSIFGNSNEREYAEEGARLRESNADEIEVIVASGRVRISEASAIESGVEIVGEIIMEAIIRKGDDPPFVIRKTIPFTEKVGIEGAKESMTASAEGYVTSATCNVTADGEDAVVVMNVIAEYHAEACEKCTMPVVTDAYLKECDTENTYDRIEYFSDAKHYEKELMLEIKIPRSETGCGAVRDILCIDTELRSVSVNRCAGGVEFSGEAVISGVACELNDSGAPSFSQIKYQTPFTLNANTGWQIPEEADIEYTLVPTDVSASLDADFIYVISKIRTAIKSATQKSLKRLSACAILPQSEYAKSSSRITVYYPSGDESLFEVAKRFHTSAKKIAADNNLVESAALTDSFNKIGKKKIIIR